MLCRPGRSQAGVDQEGSVPSSAPTPITIEEVETDDAMVWNSAAELLRVGSWRRIRTSSVLSRLYHFVRWRRLCTQYSSAYVACQQPIAVLRKSIEKYAFISYGREVLQGPLAHLVERLICNEEVTGSIPVGSTKDRKATPAGGFLLLWKPERCFALAKPRGRVVRQNRDGDFERLTTKWIATAMSCTGTTAKWYS